MIGLNNNYDNSKNNDKNNKYNFTVIFCWHHSMFDGISSFPIHKNFIEILNENIKSYEKDTTENIKSNNNNNKNTIIKLDKIDNEFEKNIRSFGSLDDLRPDLTQIAKVAFKELFVPTFIKKYLSESDKYYAGEKPLKDILKNVDNNGNNSTIANTKIRLFSLEKKDFDELCKITKNNQTTVNSVFNVVTIIIIYYHLIINDKENDNKKDLDKIKLANPI